MPNERTRALFFAYALLNDLLYPAKTPGVPEQVRERARCAMRHYPDRFEIAAMAERDAGSALADSMQDVTTARELR
jgi:hypothetical protein